MQMLIPVIVVLSLLAAGQRTDQHRPGMVHSPDMVMGFDQDKTTHHFLLYDDGGAIDVSVKDATDTKNLAAIRTHLTALPARFKAGDFSQPAEVHSDTTVEGVAEMSRLSGAIDYRYEETPQGARVVIETKDAAALRAVHAFLRFQITEHKTGDPLEVTRRR